MCLALASHVKTLLTGQLLLMKSPSVLSAVFVHCSGHSAFQRPATGQCSGLATTLAFHPYQVFHSCIRTPTPSHACAKERSGVLCWDGSSRQALLQVCVLGCSLPAFPQLVPSGRSGNSSKLRDRHHANMGPPPQASGFGWSRAPGEIAHLWRREALPALMRRTKALESLE